MELLPLLSFCVIISLLPTRTLSGDYTLGMDSATSCTKTHYYKAGDIFTASANGMVHGGKCPLTFIQSGMYGDNTVEPCLSLCVKIVSYTMQNCNIKMAYHDGVHDYTPAMFDCHTFPPVMWCSSKNDLKVTVSETNKNYADKDYAITLEVKPFCGSLDVKTTDPGVVAIPKEEPKVMNKTALIVGAIVGTVSILFVMGWILYCYKKRRSEDDTLASEHYQQDRRYRSNTPTQQTNRYAPVSTHAPASSQWSSDTTGVTDLYQSHTDSMYPGGAGDINKPFHPVVQPQLSNQSHMTGSEPWYQRSAMVQGVMEKGPLPPQGQQMPLQNQNSQYLMQNQVYNYPQFNAAENPPSDTRFVVYDFDYPAPRKYSGSKMSMTHARDSPGGDADRSRFRELTPNRDRPRGMPPIDSTTTDHTSDNDDSSYSLTTEDETTTDDQMSPVKGNMYNIVPPFGYGSMVNRDPNLQFYNPSNFQPTVQRNMNPNIRDVRRNLPPQMHDQRRFIGNESNVTNTGSNVYSANSQTSVPSSREVGTGQVPSAQVPSPQVPPMPRGVERTSPGAQVPCPQTPPPPRNPAQPGNMEPLPRNVEIQPRNVENQPRNVETQPRNMETQPRNMETLPRNAEALPRNGEMPTMAGRSSNPNEELPWPHNPPPAYSPTDDDSDEAQII